MTYIASDFTIEKKKTLIIFYKNTTNDFAKFLSQILLH